MLIGGAEGDRTPDLRIANAALCQTELLPHTRARILGNRSQECQAGLPVAFCSTFQSRSALPSSRLFSAFLSRFTLPAPRVVLYFLVDVKGSLRSLPACSGA